MGFFFTFLFYYGIIIDIFEKGRIYHMKKRGLKKSVYTDRTLLYAVIIACVVGIVAIYSATLSFETNTNVIIQSCGLLLGLVAVWVLNKIDFEQYGYWSKYIYIACCALLVLVLIIGKSGDWGAQSWIRIGPIGIQPSEIAKIGFILTFSCHVAKEDGNINKLPVIGKLILHIAIPVFLILLQPDAGSAMVFGFIFIVIMFAAGISYKYVAAAAGIGAVSLPLIYHFVLGEYQKHRIQVFFNPDLDKLGSGYNVIQSKIAVGSGEFYGKGFLNGTQNQLGILPTKHTDFIFSTIAEEWGFIGAIAVVLLLFFIIFRCIKASKNTNSLYGKYICLGVSAMLIFHTFENIGMCIGLMPVTGIPLPFISYGGTSLITNLIAIGIVLSITRKKFN